MVLSLTSYVRRHGAVIIVGTAAGVVITVLQKVRKSSSRKVENGKSSVAEKETGKVRARTFTEKAVPPALDAIVIGSGIAGLGCAVTLAKDGWRVLVLEQHDTPGGSTHTFMERGFEFDSGLHYIGGEIWNPQKGGRKMMDFITDGTVEWARTGDICDVSVIAGEPMEIQSGREQFRSSFKARFPKEEAVVDAYIAAVDLMDSKAALYFVHKLLPSFLQRLLDSVMRRAFVSLASETVADVMKRIGASPELAGRLCFMWGDYGLPPSQASFAVHTMIVNHFWEGGAYPKGGPSIIGKAATGILQRHGGAVLVNAPVDSILADARGRAIGVHVAKGGAKGVDVHAPVIISAAGVRTTYTRFVPVEHRPAHVLETIEAMLPQSCAHLSLFVGLRGDNDELKLPRSNMWISPTDDHDGNTQAWYNLEPTREGIEDGSMPAVFITFPSSKDPLWAARHPGKSTCHLIAETPYKWFAEWSTMRCKHRGVDYEGFKDIFSKKLLAILFEQFPQCQNRVEVCELGTPLTSEHYLGGPKGASYGLAGIPERFAAKCLQARTSMPGLYLTGQDVLSPGVMGALTSGFLTALVVKPTVAWNRLSIVTSL